MLQRGRGGFAELKFDVQISFTMEFEPALISQLVVDVLHVVVLSLWIRKRRRRRQAADCAPVWRSDPVEGRVPPANLLPRALH